MAKKKQDKKMMVIRIPETVNSELIGMSRDCARTQLATADFVGWSNAQRKIFALLLAQIDWTKPEQSNVIELDNNEVIYKLHWDLEQERNISEYLKEELNYMVSHSCIKLQNPYTHTWTTNNLLMGATGNAEFTEVKLNPDFMPHFQGLYELAQKTGTPFVTMLEPDVLNFSSKFAYPLYSELRSCSKTGGAVNTHRMTTKQLKDLFGLSKSDYTRTRNGEQVFDRFLFEKYVINPAIEDINEAEMIDILPCEDGSYFEKEKRHGKVISYLFRYKVWDAKDIENKRRFNLENNENEG